MDLFGNLIWTAPAFGFYSTIYPDMDAMRDETIKITLVWVHW